MTTPETSITAAKNVTAAAESNPVTAQVDGVVREYARRRHRVSQIEVAGAGRGRPLPLGSASSRAPAALDGTFCGLMSVVQVQVYDVAHDPSRLPFSSVAILPQKPPGRRAICDMRRHACRCPAVAGRRLRRCNRTA